MDKKKYLKTIWSLYKKELMSYFNSPIAYIFIGVFLIIGNWLFFRDFFFFGQASVRGYFSLLPWIFLFLSPAITMRSWSEEKKSGTVEWLLTMPITDWQVVLAKFFSALSFLFIALVLTITVPISLSFLGDLDWGVVIGSYLGALFLGGAYLSLGLFISSLTKNQIIAFVLGLVACFLAFIIGYNFVLEGLNPTAAEVFAFLGLGNHFSNIAKGVIDSKDVIYYLSFIFIFLWANVLIINKRGIKN
ncbi:ABC transporter permease subunit [Candidatus Falkowbacteria bacterium]|nr:ABC transporter permease subunit [Candidatus Falkowbacteria bacterium]